MILKLGALFLASSVSFLSGVWLLVQHTGVFIIDVKDLRKDSRLFVPVPAFLADIAVPLIPERRRTEFQRGIGRDDEVFQKVSKALLTCPDGSFFEMRSRDESVTVVKAGRNILIDVQTPDETVHLQIPIAATGRVLTKLAKAD